MSQSSFTNHQCGTCGLGNLPVTEPVQSSGDTIEDAVNEARKYINPDIPLWAKITVGVGASYFLAWITRNREKSIKKNK